MDRSSAPAVLRGLVVGVAASTGGIAGSAPLGPGESRRGSRRPSGGTPLLVSLGDYNRPALEPIARFEAAGSRHYVVRFGAKAQDVVGLVSAEPAGWSARFRPRDWAQLC